MGKKKNRIEEKRREERRRECYIIRKRKVKYFL